MTMVLLVDNCIIKEMHGGIWDNYKLALGTTISTLENFVDQLTLPLEAQNHVFTVLFVFSYFPAGSHS